MSIIEIVNSNPQVIKWLRDKISLFLNRGHKDRQTRNNQSSKLHVTRSLHQYVYHDSLKIDSVNTYFIALPKISQI